MVDVWITASSCGDIEAVLQARICEAYAIYAPNVLYVGDLKGVVGCVGAGRKWEYYQEYKEQDEGRSDF